MPLSKTGAELLFEVFSQRYEQGATLVTSNLPFDEWTEVFGSERLTGPLLSTTGTTRIIVFRIILSGAFLLRPTDAILVRC